MSISNQIFTAPASRPQHIAGAQPRQIARSRFLLGLFVCVSSFIPLACSSAPPAPDNGSADTRKAASNTPPFSTKEPERYQAIRITSITETGNGENSPSSQSNQVLIARDGARRREEYSAGASGQMVHLEIPAGRFLVLPARRIYADLGSSADGTDHGNQFLDSPDATAEISPDLLLNETHAPATYERLGAETLAGRTTIKYRVIVKTGVDSQNETLIWIDDALGMPVRSEMMSQSNGRVSKVTMELKNVTLEVDERLFSWPSDYRKVEAGMILNLTRPEGRPSALKQE